MNRKAAQHLTSFSFGGKTTRSLTLFWGILFLLLWSVCPAGTIHVYSGDSIQTAINGATSGDEIIVHPGTYVENIDIGGKDINLHSEDSIEERILEIIYNKDELNDRTINVHNQEIALDRRMIRKLAEI